jgi:hypothetical protein
MRAAQAGRQMAQIGSCWTTRLTAIKRIADAAHEATNPSGNR